MKIHETLQFICTRVSFLLDIETCFIARHTKNDDWMMIAGHGILVTPEVFSISPNINFTDRHLTEVHETCILEFREAFSTKIQFKYLAKQGHDIA